ncbi:hypothetical protein BOTBODRAFT_42024 [Botryobasidium botryosum FD-172 SS1]|uniref:Uncharacterized protein n=1 Tax=Botryobasidium botryosum (strain FD-172 SS1) TaxID=930990 RepID=A0A067MWQ0_BOTB1|nr:hypothetical protein BOTBODRAFT_42024 [Botryobasidium botryosum FD-172 SS1]
MIAAMLEFCLGDRVQLTAALPNDGHHAHLTLETEAEKMQERKKQIDLAPNTPSSQKTASSRASSGEYWRNTEGTFSDEDISRIVEQVKRDHGFVIARTTLRHPLPLQKVEEEHHLASAVHTSSAQRPVSVDRTQCKDQPPTICRAQHTPEHAEGVISKYPQHHSPPDTTVQTGQAPSAGNDSGLSLHFANITVNGNFNLSNLQGAPSRPAPHAQSIRELTLPFRPRITALINGIADREQWSNSLVAAVALVLERGKTFSVRVRGLSELGWSRKDTHDILCQEDPYGRMGRFMG